MKKIFLIITAFCFISIQGCKVRNGCPANGRNIGAEKLLSGDPKVMKEFKKARKFKD